MRLQPVKQIKRANGYIVRLFDKETQSLPRIRLMDTKLSPVGNGGSGDANARDKVRVWIPANDVGRDYVLDCDRQALELMIKHNKHWFQNALTADKIREFFTDSFDAHGRILARLSDSRPCKYYMGGRTCSQEDAFEAALASDASVVIVPSAIRVSTTSFSVIWYIEEIHIQDDSEDDSVEDVDRLEIESQWLLELQQASKTVHDKMTALMQKYKYLETLNRQMHELYEIAKDQPRPDKLWNDNLEKLGQKILGVKSGQLILE